MKKSLFAITGLLTLATNASVMAASGEQSSGGLPQLNPETFTSQIFWLFVFFANFPLHQSIFTEVK